VYLEAVLDLAVKSCSKRWVVPVAKNSMHDASTVVMSSVTAMNSQLVCWHQTTRLSFLTLEEGPKILLVGKFWITNQIAKVIIRNVHYIWALDTNLHFHQPLKIHKLDTSVSLGLSHQSAFGEKCHWILWSLLAIHFSAINQFHTSGKKWGLQEI
jgi:hypothetical protein